MIAFPRIELGAITVQMRELTLGEALAVSKVPERLQEARITKFLGFALGDDTLARLLTVQERYYLLIQYLAVQDQTPLSSGIEFGAYLLPRSNPWRETVVGMLAPVWRQVRGYHAELFELLAQDVSDWLLCALAVQCDLQDWPTLPEGDAPQSALDTVVRARYEALQNMPSSDFEALAQEWQAANMAMARFLRTGFDNKGITVLPAHGGADDAPARFRPSTAFGRIVRDMAECMAEPSEPAGERLPNDDGGGA